MKIDQKINEIADLDSEIKNDTKNITSVEPSVNEINRLLLAYGFTNFKIVPHPEEPGCYQIQREDGSLAEDTLSEGEIISQINVITYNAAVHYGEKVNLTATITDDNGPRDYTSESDLTIQQIKNTFSITAPCIQKSYELTQDNYRKIISNQLMNRDYMLFHKEDSIANPSFKYHCEVGNTGIVVSKFSISTPEMDVTFIVDKCIFISKDGLAHNFYCNRANSLESDLLVHYFDAIKIKKENASGLSGLLEALHR